MPDDSERLAILVHEVRSPAAALQAIAQVVAVDDLDPFEMRRLAALARAACHVIDRLLGDVAIASLRLEDVDPGELVLETATAAQLGGARVRAVVAPELPRLRADPVRVRQALDNLVANAVVHADASEIVVAASPGAETVLLSVTDDGDGIPVEDHARIFDAGIRLRLGSPGDGLGLAIVREIVDAHGGTLTVESPPGEGATFTIALPASSP